MRKVLIVFVILLVSLVGITAWADCVDLSLATSWARIDLHRIIIYRGRTAIALLEIPYCYVYPTSEIILIEDWICNWDKIIVDDEVCDVRRVTRL